MSLKKFLVTTTIALSSSLAVAAGPSYDYLQGGYIDYDGADGFNFELSKEFNENFYGRIDYSDLEADDFDADASITRFNLGYKTAVSSSTDFIAELGYEDVEANAFGLTGDDSGYNALIGFRGMATNNVELGAYVQYSDVLESTDVTLEARYNFTKQFSIGLEVGHDDEADEHFGVNFRYNF